MEDVPLEKIGISGPILASILERFSSCQGDVDGLLFGEISEPAPSNLLDDDDDHLPNSTLVANITGFFCSGTLFSFYDPVGRLDVAALQRSLGGGHLIGWFLGRRTTPLRPSMRESAVTASLNKTLTLNSSQFPPSVFLLLSTPLSHQLIHTHEYKAFQFRPSTRLFEPKTLDVINIGPAFRGHYGAFTPNSPFPLLRPKEKKKMPVDEEKETLVSLKRTAKDQQALDLCAHGFELGRLNKLMGKDSASYTSDLEDLYAKMLAKLDGLARLVEKTSAMVNDQEHRNMKLRNKFSGLE